ncbi:hypothetical protein XENOCAPTIV_023730 [Xenoophorus captivus]|uniref:Uncharacterized protein n=1 Tax=Xenoophorus captivus TaxID=1517983 RepID=A0ABV0S5V3_9TELE
MCVEKACQGEWQAWDEGKLARPGPLHSLFCLHSRVVDEEKVGPRPRGPIFPFRKKALQRPRVFESWTGPEKLLALDELIDSCEPTQVKHMMQVIEPQFQRDFISLLPKEVDVIPLQIHPRLKL